MTLGGWLNISFDRRHEFQWLRDHYATLNDKRFFQLRLQLINESDIRYQAWLRMIRQAFGFKIPPRVQELMSSVYFAKK